MRNNDQRKAYIRNEANWKQISDFGNVRTFELVYKNASVYRQESFRDGKWRKDSWYRFGHGCRAIKMNLQQFICFLEEVDRRMPDQGEA